MIDEDDVGVLREALQLFPLASAEIRRLVELGALLRERADDRHAQGLGELVKLGQRSIELRVADVGPLHGRHDGARGLFPCFLTHRARSLPERVPRRGLELADSLDLRYPATD